ncbi:MAG: helix-turn-helix domain-containing protein [Dissulfurispiraceae bacterium]
MASGVKLRAYPNSTQCAILNCWIGCQRFVYNCKVAKDSYFRTFRNPALALTGLQTPVEQQYSQIKDCELTPWLFEVPSQILRNGAYRFMQAYAYLTAYARGVKGITVFRYGAKKGTLVKFSDAD